jgi:hypothetical protein
MLRQVNQTWRGGEKDWEVSYEKGLPLRSREDWQSVQTVKMAWRRPYVTVKCEVGKQPHMTAVSTAEPMRALKIAISETYEVPTEMLEVSFNGMKAVPTQVPKRGELRVHMISTAVQVRLPYQWVYVTFRAETHDVSVNRHNEAYHASELARRQWGLKRGDFVINRMEKFAAVDEVHIEIMLDDAKLPGGGDDIPVILWDGEQRKEITLKHGEPSEFAE